MKLTYTTISDEDGVKRLKFFFQKGRKYGEFYMEVKADGDVNGEAEIFLKDPDYASDLVEGFKKAMAGQYLCPDCLRELPDPMNSEYVCPCGTTFA